ncbi:MAG TPA: citrate/2-methylcitrate synthase [Polyangiaceae bacterium]|nr:citrate/2-methylcitrate synthase [Polyangiaceae bacterium]
MALDDGSLEGVIAARTRIAHVDGRRGVVTVRGYSLPELAASRRYEDVAYAVLRGALPEGGEGARFAGAMRAAAALSPGDARVAEALGAARPKPEALVAALVLADDAEARGLEPLARAERALARVPALCAAVAGLGAPPDAASYAGRALFALGAARRDAGAERAVEVLVALESEHGLSASTFACRVAASSGAGAGASLSAAGAALSGPRHGGATAEARAVLLEAARAGDVGAFVRARHARKERLPGFGHRIYKVADPRVPPLREAMRAMGGAPLLPVAEALEAHAAPLYAGKGVHANIDLYGAVLLDALGVDPELYVSAFVLGAAAGWLAHWAEQRSTGRLVRPESEYAGPPPRPVPPR